MDKRYIVFHRNIIDDVTGIEFKTGKTYEIIKENKGILYVDFDKKNQLNIKKGVIFNEYGFTKLLEGDLFEIISQNGD